LVSEREDARGKRLAFLFLPQRVAALVKLGILPRFRFASHEAEVFHRLMNRPREITAAAVVALIGSSLSVLTGLLLAAAIGVMLLRISQKYPGVSFHSSDPDFRQVEEIIGVGIVIPWVLGVIGIFTGRGLLSMKPWARRIAIGWSAGSSLLCLAALAYPGSKSGVQFRASPILALMLVLFPVNAWWLLLFFRSETKALFATPSGAPPVVQRPAWLKEQHMPKLVIVAAVILLIAVGAGWILRRNSPMREIERSRDAVAAITSWHYHSVHYSPGRAPETIDMDTLCPSFRHRTSSIVDENGATQVRETIEYFGAGYNHVEDRWLTAQKRPGQEDPGIFECRTDVGPLGGDDYSLPYAGVIEDGSAKRGELNYVDGESCREYDITVPTPHDPKEKDFRFSLCINEQDHLPRETHRTLPDMGREGLSLYRQWNVMKEPQLPAEISR